MKIYVRKFQNAYYVVTPNNIMRNYVNKKDRSVLYENTYRYVLSLAKYLYADCNNSEAIWNDDVNAMTNFIKFAKMYNCKAISISQKKVFPIFHTKEDAEQFKVAIDAKMVLCELKGAE